MNLHAVGICFRALALSVLFCSVVGVHSSFAQISVSGTVWIDADEDGVRDGSEPFPAPGAFTFWAVSESEPGIVLAVTTNGASGAYSFAGLSTSDAPYHVYIVIPPGATNFLTLQGIDSDFDPGSALSDTFTNNTVRDVGIVNFRPELGILKLARDTSSGRLASEGSALYVTNNTWVEYTYAITNSGNLFFSSVVFLDFPHAPNPALLDFALGSCMAPGESIVLTQLVQVTSSVTNLGVVVGDPGQFKGCESLDLEAVEATNDAVVLAVDVVVEKNFISSSQPDNQGYFNAYYEISVINRGGSTAYDLIDAPDFDGEISVLSASVTGQVSATFSGSGPYTVDVGRVISAGGTNRYWITVSNRLSAAVMFNEADLTPCNEIDEAEFEPGRGLFNESIVYYGEGIFTNRSHDCGDVTVCDPVEIGDTVWYDKDADGAPDEDLLLYGLTNVDVVLRQSITGLGSKRTTNTTHTSGANRGYYQFNPRPYGTFVTSLRAASVPVGFHIPTTPRAYTNTFVCGGNVTNNDFGLNNEYLTPIELESLSARVDGDSVLVEWTTSWESESLGYHIYRSVSGGMDGRARVSGDIIPAIGGADGHAYAWTDAAVSKGHVYHYWLVEEAENGDLAWYGPVAVSLDDAGSEDDLVRYALPPGGDALVRIRFESLLKAGLPVSQLDPSRLQVYVDGVEVARFVSSAGAALQAGDFLLFHARASDGSQRVSVRLSGEEPAISPAWMFVRPRRGDGEVRVIDSAGAGQLAFDHPGGPIRTVLTGFNVPSVWLFDVSDPERSGLIYGYATVSGDQGDYAIYLSLPVDRDMRGFAVEDSNVIDLDDVEKE